MKSLDRLQIAIAGCGVATLLVAAVGFLMVVRPQQKQSRSLDAQIAQAQAQYVGLHEQGRTKPALRAAELFQLSRAMPETDDMPGILLELSRLAGASSVTLAAVQPAPRVALTDGSSAVPLHVSVNGTWEHVAAFLRRVNAQVQTKDQSLRVAGRLFDVDIIQITAASPNEIQASITMSAFDYGAPPSPTASLGSAATTTTTSGGSQQAAGATGGGS